MRPGSGSVFRPANPPLFVSRKCHRCGVQALEGQTFAFERYPLLGERAYCPGCHRRFLTRLEILSLGFWIIIAVVAAIRSQQHGGSPWDPLPVQFTLLLGFAWLVTFPHQLGHALVATAVLVTPRKVDS